MPVRKSQPYSTPSVKLGVECSMLVDQFNYIGSTAFPPPSRGAASDISPRRQPWVSTKKTKAPVRGGISVEPESNGLQAPLVGDIGQCRSRPAPIRLESVSPPSRGAASDISPRRQPRVSTNNQKPRMGRQDHGPTRLPVHPGKSSPRSKTRVLPAFQPSTRHQNSSRCPDL